MAQQTDENDKPLTYWGGLDFTNKNANNIKSDSTQLSGTILASESLGVDNLVNKQQTAVEWFQEQIIKIVNGKCELSEIQIFEQAKQIEKDQIIAAGMNRMTDDELSYQTSEQYYNETYAENKTFKQNKFDPNFMHEWIRNNGMRPTKEKE